MSVQLEIPDGNPWWLSPNVWVVPGADPEGSAGLPVAQQPAYLWARVTNNGTEAVQGATVRFYWENPAVGFDRNTQPPAGGLVGTALVDLAVNETADVLCLAPWIPDYVNQGHECILAEAFHPAFDPLPNSPAFNVPTDRHVVQRNLQVVVTTPKMTFHLAFEVHNTSRQPRTFTLAVATAPLELLRPLIPTLGAGFKYPDEGRAIDAGFVASPCPDPDQSKGAPSRLENVEIGPYGRTGYSLTGTLQGDGALLNVVQTAGDTQVGGLTVLVLRPQKG
jgi:hypothetical protein